MDKKATKNTVRYMHQLFSVMTHKEDAESLLVSLLAFLKTNKKTVLNMDP